MCSLIAQCMILRYFLLEIDCCFLSITAIEVVSSKPSVSSVSITSSSAGKTKSQSTKWTVSKKSKYVSCDDVQ